MKARDMYICIVVFLCSLLLYIISAKTNTIYNSRYDPYTHSKVKIVSWEEVFQAREHILSKSISMTLGFCVCYFLFRTKHNQKILPVIANKRYEYSYQKKKNSKVKLYVFIFLLMTILFISESKLGFVSGGLFNSYSSSQIRIVSWENVWNDRDKIIFSILFMTISLILFIELITLQMKPKNKQKSETVNNKKEELN